MHIQKLRIAYTKFNKGEVGKSCFIESCEVRQYILNEPWKNISFTAESLSHTLRCKHYISFSLYNNFKVLEQNSSKLNKYAFM